MNDFYLNVADAFIRMRLLLPFLGERGYDV